MLQLLNIKPKKDCRWDLVSLGEVMLRLDPGDSRVSTTRSFQVWEGGGEYNVARRSVRNGLNFTERGFGARAALGCSDRGHTAVSQLKAGDVDWDKIFGDEGARWFHTGGIFCALSETTPQVAREAIAVAKKHGRSFLTI